MVHRSLLMEVTHVFVEKITSLTFWLLFISIFLGGGAGLMVKKKSILSKNE